MARRAPPLYRLSQVLQAIGTVVIVVVMVYLAAAIYSASQLKGNAGDQRASSTVSLLSNGTALVLSSVNLTNPGFFAINGLSVSLQVRDPAGALLAVGGVTSVTIPAQGNGTVPIQVWIPLGGSASTLVTHDASLTDHVWLNASYASLFVLHIGAEYNYSWGAPLFGLNATPGTPTVLGNGSVQVPVTVTFQNHAGFSDVGSVAFTVQTSSGATCGSGGLAINTPAGASYAQTADITLSAGCDPSGGHVLATYSGNGMTLTLPPEAIP